MKTNIIYFWESRRIQDIGPGDADVCTKSGRHTTVKLNISKPQLEQHAKRLKVHVIYDVIEGHKDYTHLQTSTDILIPIPVDWKNIKLPGVSDYLLNMVIYGKNHRWNPVSILNANWLQSLEVKIDGPGDDDEGNAGLRINFSVPIEYEIGN